MAGTVQPPSFETGSVVAQTIYIRSFDSIKVTDPESDDPDLQVQLDSKEDKINLTTHRAVVTNDAGGVAVSNVTDLELSYVSGVTSSIQTQLNSKQQNITGAASTVITSNLDASRAVVSDASGKLAASGITTTELDCLDNVSSNIQDQLNSKQATVTGAATSIVSSDLATGLTLVSDGAGKVAVSGVSATDLAHVSGVTSSIQNQLNSKQATVTGAATSIVSSNLTSNRALVSDGTGKVAVSGVSATDLSYVSGVTSSIQTQINALQIPNTTISSDTNFSETGSLPFQMYTASALAKQWFSMGTAPDNTVRALCAVGTDLYVGGSFSAIGGSTIARIAKFDTISRTWSALSPGGVPTGTVYVIYHHGSDLYVGGQFTTPSNVGNCVAKYNLDTLTWSTFKNGITSGVSSFAQALAMVGDYLYVVGNFTQVDGSIPVRHIAKYDTVNEIWSAVGTGTDQRIECLAVLGNDVYIGGNFTEANGVPHNRIVKYDTDADSWTTPGTGAGASLSIESMVVIGTDLYVSGGTAIDGISMTLIGKYDSQSNVWSNVTPVNANATVSELLVSGTDIYVGGAFTAPSGFSSHRILKYDTLTGSVTGLQNGLTGGSVTSLAVIGTKLYASGFFTAASGVANTAGVAACDLATPIHLKTVDGSNIIYSFTQVSESALIMKEGTAFSSKNNALSLFISPSTSPAINPKECIGTATSDTTPVTVDISHASYTNAPVVTLTVLDAAGTTLLCPQLTEVTSTSFKFIVLNATSTAVTGITCHWRAVGI